MLGETTTNWQSKRREATRREILAAAWESAREHGLGALTLRDVAQRVGMRPPSLYSHFDSKRAIYDAMYADAWTVFIAHTADSVLPSSPRAALKEMARVFFDFAVADLARHQLMNLRVVPDFTPSQESYAVALTSFARMQAGLGAIGVRDGADIDLYTALIGGLVDQQWANDPGGTRWARLLDRAVGMYADELGLPKEETR